MIVLLLGCTTAVDVSPILPDEVGRAGLFAGERSPADDTSPPAEEPVNILVVISDDLGIEASACYSDQIDASRAAQPTIEGLCADGLTFTDAWSYPLCSPSRAAMMTGRYSWRTGVGRALDENTEPLSTEEISVPDVIGGDQHAYIGKWHLTGQGELDHPAELGWAHFSGTLGGVLESYDAYEKTTNGTPMFVENYATVEVVDDALEWLSGRGTEPWMMWLSFNAPHRPLHAPPDDLHNFDLTGMDPNTRPVPHYQAMIEAMDTELARLIEAVDRENTVIIYLGDNGSETTVNQGSYPQGHGKGTLGQGGVHVPLIMTGPGVPYGKVNAMVHVVDLYATILELSGASLPEDVELDSISLIPYLEDPDLSPLRQIMLTELFGYMVPEFIAGRAARTSRYKMIRLFTGNERLYDLYSDPTETVDLMQEPLSEEARSTAQLLGSYLDQINAKADH